MRKYLCNRLGDEQNFDIVAIASSLAGVAALSVLVAALPANFPAPIVIAQHLSPDAPSHLAEILGRVSSLRVKQAAEGDRLAPATIYVAPPNHHLTLQSREILSLSQSPKVNFTRPSADVLFDSVAAFHKERAIGVVLTGKLYDGAAGARTIKNNGGRVIAQDEETAVAFDMPRAAIRAGAADFMLSLDRIAPALISLVMIKGLANVLDGSMPLSHI